jgi:hypothetical protein
MKVYADGKVLDTSQPKAAKWKPAEPKPRELWGLCPCGAVILVGDSVWMYGDHDRVVCLDCQDKLPEGHLDCAGLILPGVALFG